MAHTSKLALLAVISFASAVCTNGAPGSQEKSPSVPGASGGDRLRVANASCGDLRLSDTLLGMDERGGSKWLLR
jgi:hypothetical protein